MDREAIVRNIPRRNKQISTAHASGYSTLEMLHEYNFTLPLHTMSYYTFIYTRARAHTRTANSLLHRLSKKGYRK